jgi:hypothetical protein
LHHFREDLTEAALVLARLFGCGGGRFRGSRGRGSIGLGKLAGLELGGQFFGLAG